MLAPSASTAEASDPAHGRIDDAHENYKRQLLRLARRYALKIDHPLSRA
jgi:hypothetical protein